MSDVPKELKYTKTHEWASRGKDEVVTVGITSFAQHQLGDIVFIEMPEIGAELQVGDEFGVIESVKAASDLYAPFSGKVLAVNGALAANPGLVNADPYREGWIVKIQPDNIDQWEELMSAQDYEQHLEKASD